MVVYQFPRVVVFFQTKGGYEGKMNVFAGLGGFSQCVDFVFQLQIVGFIDGK